MFLLDRNSVAGSHAADDGLYNIVNSEEPASHLLKIDISEPGFEMYTFTFG